MRYVFILMLIFTMMYLPLNGQFVPIAVFNTHPTFCEGTVGGVDTTFGTDGFLQVDYNSSDNLNQWLPNVFDTDSQGRIYLSGWDSSGAYNIPVVVRVTPNGDIDTTFGTSGFQTHDLGVGANGKSIQIYNLNGKLLIERDGINDNWIDLPDKKGLYIIQVFTEDGESFVRKIVRE